MLLPNSAMCSGQKAGSGGMYCQHHDTKWVCTQHSGREGTEANAADLACISTLSELRSLTTALLAAAAGHHEVMLTYSNRPCTNCAR